MLIGLTGFGFCGKDETAKILIREHNFARVAFADPLKNLAYNLNPLLTSVHHSPPQFRLKSLVDKVGWEAAKKDWPQTREYLQQLGVEIREIDPKFWVRNAFRRIGELDWDQSVVISDCRFPNELKKIKRAGGFIWRINRPGVGPANAHVSEHAWVENIPDAVIVNDGTLEELAWKVSAAFRMFKMMMSGEQGFAKVTA